ncbi:hypothetical protein [Ottowia sp.]|uniref:hypothetical protein n=1 Tax=Ottowia sp. TaxID=1898956 RepID=UPI003927F0E4|nr:hypothetical protein [Pseudomonadota bacterium]
MDILIALALAFAVFAVLRGREQAHRIALLGRVLGPYRIEPMLESLTEGYLRWLHEADAERRAQIWGTLAATEQTLAAQFSRFAADFARVPAPQAQISKLPFALPYAQPLLPGRWLFDARRLFELHARAIDALARNTAGLPHKERAYRMTAELYLMQHSCHWFCRSKNLASARLLARHRSSYAQVLAAVAPETRRDYEALVR